jgi:hypothetical protein
MSDKRKRACVFLDHDTLGKLLGLPPGVSVIRVTDDLNATSNRPDSAILVLGGPGLPDECEHRPNDMVTNLDPKAILPGLQGEPR